MIQLSSRGWLIVGALIVLIVSLGATLVAESTSNRSQAAQTVDPIEAPSPPALVHGKLGFGVAYGDTLTWKADKDLGQGLDDAVALGATWARVDLSWNDIQPDSPNEFIWHRFDRIAQAARARNLNVLATIAYTPAWARQPGCTAQAKCAPADPAKFAAFAQAAAKRYSAMGVHTWEVWNEPNIGFWAPHPDPAAYATLLAETATALRKGDDHAFVIMAGLAAVGTNAQRGYIGALDYLTAVAKLGALNQVDAIAYHPYNGQYLPSANTSVPTAFEKLDRTKESVESVLADYGAADLPIWITETGANTNAPGPVADGSTYVPDATHVNEAMQARVAADTVKTLSADHRVAAMFWYCDQDSALPLDYTDLAAFYGLRRYDGSKKPAFDTLKQTIFTYDRARP